MLRCVHQLVTKFVCLLVEAEQAVNSKKLKERTTKLVIIHQHLSLQAFTSLRNTENINADLKPGDFSIIQPEAQSFLTCFMLWHILTYCFAAWKFRKSGPGAAEAQEGGWFDHQTAPYGFSIGVWLYVWMAEHINIMGCFGWEALHCSWWAGWHLAWQPLPSVYECVYQVL